MVRAGEFSGHALINVFVVVLPNTAIAVVVVNLAHVSVFISDCIIDFGIFKIIINSVVVFVRCYSHTKAFSLHLPLHASPIQHHPFQHVTLIHPTSSIHLSIHFHSCIPSIHPGPIPSTWHDCFSFNIHTLEASLLSVFFTSSFIHFFAFIFEFFIHSFYSQNGDVGDGHA